MSEQSKFHRTSPESPIYQIRVRGHLSDRWGNWFEELTITLDDNGTTLLTGQIVDQAELYGVLRRVRDLGISLISVNRIETDNT